MICHRLSEESIDIHFQGETHNKRSLNRQLMRRVFFSSLFIIEYPQI